MKASIIIILFFIAGVICGIYSFLPESLYKSDLAMYALYLLLLLVGIVMGGNMKVWQMFKQVNMKIILIPLSIISGTLIGTGLLSFLLEDITLREALAVVSGFRYHTSSRRCDC